ncbi:MAG: hypothetical protein PHI41_04295 [Erysipelotrichaceae bacterium]|nr:hypothetical protein [Erysipelotrichaceae bacterium]MDD3810136.1 hypothetical protein [Erysipelotrichaceae bacterium]
MSRKEVIIYSYEKYSIYILRAVIFALIVFVIAFISSLFITVMGIIAYFALTLLIISFVQYLVLKLVLYFLKRK